LTVYTLDIGKSLVLPLHCATVTGRPAVPSQSRRAYDPREDLPSHRWAGSSRNDVREEASMGRDVFDRQWKHTYLMALGTGLLLVTGGCASHSSPSAGTTVAVTPSASVAGGVDHMVTGEVTDVDRNSGKVSFLASDGSKIQLILPPLAVATANKGDRASINITIGPAR
jgi:hypothetical protein